MRRSDWRKPANPTPRRASRLESPESIQEGWEGHKEHPYIQKKNAPLGQEMAQEHSKGKTLPTSLQPRSGQRKQTPCRQVNNLWK